MKKITIVILLVFLLCSLCLCVGAKDSNANLAKTSVYAFISETPGQFLDEDTIGPDDEFVVVTVIDEWNDYNKVMVPFADIKNAGVNVNNIENYFCATLKLNYRSNSKDEYGNIVYDYSSYESISNIETDNMIERSYLDITYHENEDRFKIEDKIHYFEDWSSIRNSIALYTASVQSDGWLKIDEYDAQVLLYNRFYDLKLLDVDFDGYYEIGFVIYYNIASYVPEEEHGVANCGIMRDVTAIDVKYSCELKFGDLFVYTYDHLNNYVNVKNIIKPLNGTITSYEEKFEDEQQAIVRFDRKFEYNIIDAYYSKDNNISYLFGHVDTESYYVENSISGKTNMFELSKSELSQVASIEVGSDVVYYVYGDKLIGFGDYAASDSNDIENFVVNFDANIGTVITEKIYVINGENYGTLPIPSHNYYLFDGWYTQSGDTKIESSTIVRLDSDQTLYAKWRCEEFEQLQKYSLISEDADLEALINKETLALYFAKAHTAIVDDEEWHDGDATIFLDCDNYLGAIQFCFIKGIFIDKYGGYFYPKRNVELKDAIIWAVNSLKYSVEYDITTDDYWQPFYRVAKRIGLLDNLENTLATKKITTAEMVILIHNMLNTELNDGSITFEDTQYDADAYIVETPLQSIGVDTISEDEAIVVLEILDEEEGNPMIEVPLTELIGAGIDIYNIEDYFGASLRLNNCRTFDFNGEIVSIYKEYEYISNVNNKNKLTLSNSDIQYLENENIIIDGITYSFDTESNSNYIKLYTFKCIEDGWELIEDYEAYDSIYDYDYTIRLIDADIDGNFDIGLVSYYYFTLGDMNGDGKFTYTDVTKLYACFRGIAEVAESADTDVNGDGKFSYTDITRLYAIFRGIASFE